MFCLGGSRTGDDPPQSARRRTGSRWRCRTALILAAAPAVASAQGTREFGAATFSPPPGWNLEVRPTVETMTLIRAADLCMVVVYGDEVSPPSLEEAFANAWSSVFRSGSYRSAPRPAPRAEVSPAGYRHLAGESEIIDAGNNPFVARLHVFPAGARTQTIVWIGNSRNALQSCRPDWDAFFAPGRSSSTSSARAIASIASRSSPWTSGTT